VAIPPSDISIAPRKDNSIFFGHTIEELGRHRRLQSLKLDSIFEGWEDLRAGLTSFPERRTENCDRRAGGLSDHLVEIDDDHADTPLGKRCGLEGDRMLLAECRELMRITDHDNFSRSSKAVVQHI